VCAVFDIICDFMLSGLEPARSVDSQRNTGYEQQSPFNIGALAAVLSSAGNGVFYTLRSVLQLLLTLLIAPSLLNANGS
jgi:hypothetical protein